MSRRKPYETMQGAAERKLWTSAEQRRDRDASKDAAQLEFLPGAVGDVVEPTPEQEKARLGRRGFLGFGAATAALFSEACLRRNAEKILPYTKAPEYVIPGVPNHYATVLDTRGEMVGAVIESHEGRPTKIEGNELHPTSAGSTDLLMQASVMSLYDPDRSDSARHGGKRVKMDAFDDAFDALVTAAQADGGAKLRVLAQPTSSPTVVRLREAMKDKLPHARVHTWSPVAETNVREGGKIAVGQAVMPLPDYQRSRVIVALDCDFLLTEQGAVRAARQFARGRKLDKPEDPMSRLYVVEPGTTITGSNADHRLRLPARDIEVYLRALATELAAQGVDLGAIKGALGGDKPAGVPEKWLKVVAKELASNKAKSVVVAGRRQPAHVHALVAAINTALDNVGSTITYAPVVDVNEPADLAADLKVLTDDMGAGKVDTLVIIGGNPAYDAPAELGFKDKLASVKNSVHLSSHVDETSEKCAWHVPMAHELEAWGDGRALDGTWSIRQPQIDPLHGGRSDIEIWAKLTGSTATPYAIVRETFRAAASTPSSFESAWAKALQSGVVDKSNSVRFDARASLDDVATALGKHKPAGAPIGDGNVELTFGPCPKMHDGRHVNNPWLQELPDPMTKMVWDNAALVSPKMAKRLGLSSGDMVTISRGNAQLEIAVWVQPGLVDNSVQLTLGWGRNSAGRYGNGRGFDVGALRSAASLGFVDGAKVTPSGKTYDLVQTQDHHNMEGRPIALDATLDKVDEKYTSYRDNPEFTKFKSPTPKTLPLWDPVQYTGHKWGMAFDLNACTGCSACVVACTSENNVAFVGKDQVYRGREMHWIRIDRYFTDDNFDGDNAADDFDPIQGESLPSNPPVVFQPMACVHCEEAPCENVCPVNATAHSQEGLNDMAYNRCIGTRYCANNCPYKVRRFNYLNWRGEMYGEMPETEKMQFNPNVTVRMRGVMEKCSYCVQRIEEGKIAARRDGRTLGGNDVITACQQACPSEAIVFGDLNDPNSKVAKWHKADRSYAVLADIGTRPRTAHLGKVRNPNKEMMG